MFVRAAIPDLLRVVLRGVLAGQTIGEALDALELDESYQSAILAWIIEAYDRVTACSTINASDIVRAAIRNAEDEIKSSPEDRARAGVEIANILEGRGA